MIDSLVRTRKDVAECLAIVDELFPLEQKVGTANCSACGWPRLRAAGECQSGEHIVHQQWDGARDFHGGGRP